MARPITIAPKYLNNRNNGIGGMNHNFYFSIYARENREISSSSAFSIGVLISSALLILTGGGL